MIPLKIETLLEGQVVEKNRVEYKAGWNPSDIIHTICAFANDLDNVNGGYLVIGVAENEGIPILSPIGIKPELLDMIQQVIFQYGNRIEPRYIPTIEGVKYPGPAKWIDMEKFSKGKVRARRIGEFFKELDLSEKQSTGIPTILNELAKNGSPMPEFDTDPERNYLETTIKIRDGFSQTDKVSDKMSDKQKAFYLCLMKAFESSDYVTTKIMTSYSKMPGSTTRRYLNQFCNMQILKSDGKNKGTKYYLI